LVKQPPGQPCQPRQQVETKTLFYLILPFFELISRRIAVKPVTTAPPEVGKRRRGGYLSRCVNLIRLASLGPRDNTDAAIAADKFYDL
jgi:hypothetical protein